jgi:hypothetical protein
MKLADAMIHALAPPTKSVRFVYDTHPKSPASFGVYITPSGVRSYFMNYKTRSGIQRTQTIGRAPSWSVAQAREKTAEYRRETKVFEDAVQHGGLYVLTLDDVIASRGGIPLIENGKIIGAIGCSGGTGSQDAAVCSIGADMVK